jgi:hypothetical protein
LFASFVEAARRTKHGAADEAAVRVAKGDA